MSELSVVKSRLLCLVPICLMLACAGALLLSYPRARESKPNSSALQLREGSYISPLFAGTALDVDGLPPFVGGTYVPPTMRKAWRRPSSVCNSIPQV